MSGRDTMRIAREHACGFLTEAQVAAIAADPETSLTLLLVRCGGGRFLAPADQVQHFIDIIEQHAEYVSYRTDRTTKMSDYVRDVSLPAQNGVRP